MIKSSCVQDIRFIRRDSPKRNYTDTESMCVSFKRRDDERDQRIADSS